VKSPKPQPQSHPPSGHRAHVAVAEDDAEMRRLVAEALRRDGHDVVELADGGRLLVRLGAQYRAHGPAAALDLVVTDIRMPVVTGLAIVRSLREAHNDVPVVLMTAFGDERTREEARSLGAVLLDKPFKLDELRRTVAGLLARASAGAE
jgi:DNA-binding response OmpR family regulator